MAGRQDWVVMEMKPISDGHYSWEMMHYRRAQGWRPESGGVIEETLVCFHLNGQELATFMCTPCDLEAMALGFLRAEGLIRGPEDVRLVERSPSDTCVDIWLRDLSVQPPRRAIVTSGCGGGVTFDDLSRRYPPLASRRTLAPEQVGRLMQLLNEAASLYRQVRGVHTSALSDGERLLVVAEDVGRHNTIDKVWGKAMMGGIETRDQVLLATGRISSEMLNKARRMEVPIVISRTSPTSLTLNLAQVWNITVIGYARRDRFTVYTHGWRVGVPAAMMLPVAAEVGT